MTSTIKVDTIKDQASTNIVNKCGTTINIGAPGDTTKVAANTIRSNALQNACGGNTISKCGTTVTIGQSGDTVNLASGASQSGFGRTGTVDWDTGSIKTTTFTAVSGNGYFCNTSAAGFTMNLPTSPSVGDIVALKDYASSFGTYNLTIGRGGSKMNGSTVDSTRSTNNESLTLVYADALQGWLAVEEGTGFVGESFLCASVSGSCNTLTTCGDYKIATFVNPGCFTVNSVSGVAADNVADYLVVAGGGGAQCAGGGAGGVRMSGGTSTGCYTVSPLGSSPSPVTGLTLSTQTYPITVGAGGAGHGPAPPPSSTPGDASTFDSITAAGGGSVNATTGSSAGGSGGGAYGPSFPCGSAGNTPPTTPPQGQPGGNKTSPGSASAGGGGAGGTGSDAPSPRVGGIGTYSAINPSPSYGTPGPVPAVRYFGGGGGGGSSSPAGFSPTGTAAGGGGCGTASSGTLPRPGVQCGTANTGGGGGGAWFGLSGGGGSGIVIIRYKFQ